MYLKGNTHCPLGVEQGVRPRSSLEQELVVEAVSQSPHLQSFISFYECYYGPITCYFVLFALILTTIIAAKEGIDM